MWGLWFGVLTLTAPTAHAAELALEMTPAEFFSETTALYGLTDDLLRTCRAGDINGDGELDVLIGGRRGYGVDSDGNARENSGRVYLLAAADVTRGAHVGVEALAWRTWLGGGKVDEGEDGFGAKIELIPGAGGQDVAVICSPEQGDFEGKCFVMTELGEGSTTGVSAMSLGTFYLGADAVGGKARLGDGLAVGDLTGDGVAELVFGARGFDVAVEDGEPINNAGAAFVVSGDATHDWRLWSGDVELDAPGDVTVSTITGVISDERLGYSAYVLDDLSGDEISELVLVSTISESCALSGEPQARVSLFFGSEALVRGEVTAGVTSADLRLEIPCSPGEIAEVLITAAAPGDLDGDGEPDLMVGVSAFFEDGEEVEGPGSVWIFYGPISQWSGTFDLLDGSALGAAGEYARIVGISQEAGLGAAILGGHDLNGDGHGDVALGSPGVEDDTGAVYVVYGNSERLTGELKIDQVPGVVTLRSTVYDERFGATISGADLDGDGLVDLLVSAPRYEADLTRPEGGRVVVLWGVTDALRGDVDGDGYTQSENDCDDYDSSISPAAFEGELGDHVDNDCDQVVDEGTNLYDDDGDGFSEEELDCDDTNPLRLNQSQEPTTPDGIDNDCDSRIDEDSREEPRDPPALDDTGVISEAPSESCGCGSSDQAVALVLAPLLLGLRRRKRSSTFFARA